MKLSPFFFSFALALLAVTAGCGGSSNDGYRTAQLGEPAIISWYSPVRVVNEELRITMKSVPEDSRCRPEVACLTEGRLRIVFQLQNWRGVFEQESQLPRPEVEPAVVPSSGYHIEVVDAPLQGRGRTSALPYWPITIRVSKVN